MCTLCFVVSVVIYLIGTARADIKKANKEWLEEQHEVRKHVTK